jgi:ubiquinone/menaquinone biosynthesis C-methylase UbiE
MTKRIPFVDEAAGTPETREFYDQFGWHTEDGKTNDMHLFGAHLRGPIRDGMHMLRTERIREIFDRVGQVRLLEAGCGGNPATEFLDLCERYTGIDFSQQGINVSRVALEGCGVPHELMVGDICKMPFEDGSFDAVYSAHVLYHIADEDSQRRALEEIARVLRPGGVAVLILANPFPFLFPGRFVAQALAKSPLGSLLRRFRASPLPYLPMSIGWTEKILSRFGTVETSCYGLSSTWFSHHVGEQGGIGQHLWGAMRFVEEHLADRIPRAGCYVQYVLRRAA